MNKFKELEEVARRQRIKLAVHADGDNVVIDIFEKGGVQLAVALRLTMPNQMFGVLPLGDVLGKVLSHMDAKG